MLDLRYTSSGNHTAVRGLVRLSRLSPFSAALVTFLCACHLSLRLCGGGPNPWAWADTWRLITHRSCGHPRMGRRSVRKFVAACGVPEPLSLTAHLLFCFVFGFERTCVWPHQTYAISSWGPCVRRGHQSVQHGLVRVRK